jgi:cell division protease FtsH
MNPSKPSSKKLWLIVCAALIALGASLTMLQPLMPFTNLPAIDSRPALIQEMAKDTAAWTKSQQDFSRVLADMRANHIAAAGVTEAGLLITTTSGEKYSVSDDWGQFSLTFLSDYAKSRSPAFPFAILKPPGAGADEMGAAEWFQLLFGPLLIVGLIIAYVLYNRFGMFYVIQKGSELTFKDVVGVAEAKTALVDVVSYLASPARFSEMGAKPPKGILLAGPPGVGKTVLARALAGECNANFIAVTGSDFTSKFYGAGIQRVKALFRTARQKAPCIIFIDEADGIGRRTEQASAVDAESNRIINQILTEMDGFHPAAGVIVIGATNFASSLDPALTREGRFDQKITVSLPGVDDRKALFDHYLAKSKAADDIDTEQLARMSIGMSPASISYIITKAAFLAAKGGEKQIDNSHILESIDVFRLGGTANTGLMLTEEERRRIAYHEAGHAIIGAYLDVGVVEKVTIIPRGESLGVTVIAPERDTKLHLQTKLESRIQMLLAGRMAEQLYFGEVSSGAASDLAEASKLAYSMVSSLGMGAKGELFSIEAFRDLNIPPDHARYLEEANAMLDSLNKQCMANLQLLEAAIHDVANELLGRETIPGSYVIEAIELVVAAIEAAQTEEMQAA